MDVLISIDDTDTLETPGTGHLLEDIKNALRERNLGTFSRTTRHQLLVHEEVPYTSHNSTMCCAAALTGDALEVVIAFCRAALGRLAAPGSDPGLAVVVPERLAQRQQLIDFGARAKTGVLTKAAAYALAVGLGVHLSEHGGTGGGVIGALAGLGLRLGGNDGRFRGWFTFPEGRRQARVSELLELTEIDGVQTLDGRELEPAARVQLDDRLKTVLRDARSILLVVPRPSTDRGPLWQLAPKETIKTF